MSFASNLASLQKFSQRLNELPRSLGNRIATKAAPALTAAARETFSASEDAFGIPWEPGADGGTVTLRKTGALARFIQYVSIGTKVRVALGVAWAKYQVGRRQIFPRQGDPLPKAYVDALKRIAHEEIRASLGGSR